MTNEELQQLVEEVSSRYFGRLFRHQAIFNKRLRTTGGRYMLQTHHLEFNRDQLAEHGVEALIDIIKHELCHYHLHLEGRGYQHKDQDFKQLCAQTGAPRHCQPLAKHTGVKYSYICRQCRQHYFRKRRLDITKYRCGICRGELRLTRKV